MDDDNVLRFPGTSDEFWSEIAESLQAYAADQVEREPDVALWRQVSQGKRPWPASDNPMLSYLVQQASHMARHEDLDTVLVWLAAHSWYEGGIAEMVARRGHE